MIGAGQVAIIGGGDVRGWSRTYKSSAITISSSWRIATTSDTTQGLAVIGSLPTAILSGRKSYFELVADVVEGGLTLVGGIQSNTSGTTLGANYIRFWSDNASPDEGTITDWYLGSHLSSKAYTADTFDDSPPQVIGWAIDTSASKVWVTRNGTTWIGGGNPETGVSPTFSINVSGWVPRVETYFYSGPSGTASAILRYAASQFSFTRPVGF